MEINTFPVDTRVVMADGKLFATIMAVPPSIGMTCGGDYAVTFADGWKQPNGEPLADAKFSSLREAMDVARKSAVAIARDKAWAERKRRS